MASRDAASKIGRSLSGGSATCIIAVVDAPAGDEFKENSVMVELAAKYRNDPFSFVWVDANSQGDFIAAFGLSKAGAYTRSLQSST